MDVVQAKVRPIFVEHVMKTGGSFLCAQLMTSRGCHYSVSLNCRMPGRLNRSSPDFSRISSSGGFKQTCNIIFDEPAYKPPRTAGAGLSDTEGLTPLPAPTAPFWSKHFTVLLVRSPWRVFYSYASELRRLKPNAFAFWDRGRPFNTSVALDANDTHTPSARVPTS